MVRRGATPITVAIPTHDRAGTVVSAVRSALAQTRPPEAVVVLCDGCTDGTPEAVAALGDARVKVLDLPKAPGYGYSHRNEALELAAGGAVAWLGDDDLYLPDHLERVGALLDTGDVDLVQAAACVVGVDSELEPWGMDWRLPAYRRQLLRGHNRTPMGAVAHLARPALEAGGWNDDLPRRGDLDLWQRMLRHGARTAMVATPTLLYFRGTARRQAAADRADQNERFLARMGDPRELTRLRSAIDLALHRQAARWMAPARRAWWWARTLASR